MNLVEKQYTSWVYPLPIEDLKKAFDDGSYREIGDPMIEWPRYWPRKRAVGKLDILIAGCGTNQAAYYASRNRDWNVVGIDLSDASLAHQQKLKDKHNLKNLRLEKLNLLDVKSLGLTFDLIVSCGVLHHLSQPEEGLLALKGVLRFDGVMNLMVYGTSLRIGIYMMQEVFRELGFKQTKDDVDLVRLTVDSLHPEHALKRYMKKCSDCKYDAGIVDTFLHTQDKSFYVNEVYEFTRKAGLEFVSWIDPLDYSLEDHMPPEHPLWKKISGISLEKKAHICDLLVQEIGTHRWIAAHPSYAEKIIIPVNSMELLNCTLILNSKSKIVEKANPLIKLHAQFERYNSKFTIHYEFASILEKLNKDNSVKKIIDSMDIKVEDKELLYKISIKEITRLYEAGHLYVLLPNFSESK